MSDRQSPVAVVAVAVVVVAVVAVAAVVSAAVVITFMPSSTDEHSTSRDVQALFTVVGVVVVACWSLYIPATF